MEASAPLLSRALSLVAVVTAAAASGNCEGEGLGCFAAVAASLVRGTLALLPEALPLPVLPPTPWTLLLVLTSIKTSKLGVDCVPTVTADADLLLSQTWPWSWELW